ncbi:MAG: protein-L-isoaspartate(D-aspartate) O-methyltransferase [Kiloniellales bacterium]|nr:protein-L-isoaspartate(D-aspartate) O-methyltransferase [Kiloniellales bacterium]
MTMASRMIRLIMQLRSAGISDTAVLSAIERVPREAFVPEAFLDQAYENMALPIGHGQTLSQPQIVAVMTEALQAGPRSKVLEIGTGSGYQAAILSKICRRVYTIERHRELLAMAESRFNSMRLHNITTRAGDGWKGWTEQAPFERIIVTAAPAEVPATLLDQLAPGGVMIIPLGSTSREQRLFRIRKDEEGALHEDDLGAVRFVPLVPGLPGTEQIDVKTQLGILSIKGGP